MNLFDLDGTLTDPKIGITKSVQYALKRMGIDEPDLDRLECFIGPPLMESFSTYYQMNEADARKAIGFYRERFKEKGLFENALYPDVPNLLQSLKDARHTLIVATSKPTVFSERILTHFRIDGYFDAIVGSNLDGTRSAKAEIIQYILNHYQNRDPDQFVMVGDRKHDIIGAKESGIDSIGVTYGYGSIEEIRCAEPTYVADDRFELGDLLMDRSLKNRE
ncbi:HAD family hydrolase [Sporolactobacillus sp. THM7-7]|nr:HAD family hydrolase [Sporolactobacillus sp. THM7-7]